MIFVDFFDTLVWRHTTAREAVKQWATCIRGKFPQLAGLSEQELLRNRKNAFSEMRKALLENSAGHTEVHYTEVMENLYNKAEMSSLDIEKRDFICLAEEIELAVELGCTYANKYLLEELKRQKIQGKKIYIVSDFYLSAEKLEMIMAACDIPREMFDGIFVSCDIGKRKANGDIYPFLIEELHLKSEQILMIGDNKKSDYEIPKSFGIRSIYKPNIIHKLSTHIREKKGQPFSYRQYRCVLDEMYRHGMEYSEYIGIFYVFTKRLYHMLEKRSIEKITFMAREGFYLKKLFEEYQNLRAPYGRKIQTSYFWCSRRSVFSGILQAHHPKAMDGEISLRNWLKSLNISVEEAQKFVPFQTEEADQIQKLEEATLYHELINNQEFHRFYEDTIMNNRKAFMQYMKDYLDQGVFRFVDSGWKCTTQNAIEKYYETPTEGIYIGVQKADRPIRSLKKHGLIFCQENPQSDFYEYLGTNIPFYQQLLAAPHGTALKYEQGEDGITVLHEWDPMEQKLYFDKIEKLQQYMFLKFCGLCVWDSKKAYDRKEDWYIARLSMRSSFFANGKRLRFIRECTDNYVQNFRQESRGKVRYDIKKVHFGLEVIFKPEKLIRYVGKIQRTAWYDKKSVKVIYPMAAHILYGYILLLQTIKNIRNGRKNVETG